MIAEIILAVSQLTWPGAFAVAAMSLGAVGLAFAFVEFWKSL